MRETEIKIKVENKNRILDEMRRYAGGEMLRSYFEDDTLYDFNDMKLFKQGAILRLRASSLAHKKSGGLTADKSASRYTLTWKGVLDVRSAFKEREELELDVSDPSALFSMLKTLGVNPVFRYQKFRIIAELENVKLLLDETPMGSYIEIEGDAENINNTAQRLGFSASDYITLDYFQLWRAYCAEKSMNFTDMIFTDKRD